MSDFAGTHGVLSELTVNAQSPGLLVSYQNTETEGETPVLSFFRSRNVNRTEESFCSYER
jgi:hypothetical protein